MDGDQRAITTAEADDGLAELPQIVGRNLRRIRTRRGYSLERLAKLSGVSRAMLGQIETGKSVPTIGLLWKVSTSLNIPFATLISDQEARGLQVLRRDRSKILVSSGGRFTSRALFPFGTERQVEFYELRLAPNHIEIAEPHAPGTTEILVVVSGAVEIVAGKDPPQVLSEGDSIFFEADLPHSYRNLRESETVMYLVMSYVETLFG